MSALPHRIVNFCSSSSLFTCRFGISSSLFCSRFLSFSRHCSPDLCKECNCQDVLKISKLGDSSGLYCLSCCQSRLSSCQVRDGCRNITSVCVSIYYCLLSVCYSVLCSR